MGKIEQPAWCDYPRANVSVWGCWGLILGMVKDESFCKEHKCEYYRKGGNDED